MPKAKPISWVKAEDAPPARTQEKLTKTFPQARVENFAFFTPSFVKDVMLLEAALEANDGKFPVDAVIITLSDSYFYSPFQKSLIELVPYISLNRSLLKRFSDRLNARMYCETCQAIRESRTASYIRLYDSLSKANRTHRGRFEEYVLEQTSIYRYKTFLTFLKLNVWDPDGFWQREYRIGDKPMFPTRLPKPPEKFGLNDAGFSAQTTDIDQVALINDVLEFLEHQNIKVYIFLRPYAPVEWRDHPFPPNPMNVETLIHAQGWDKKATIVDLRWALYGDQFSDSLVHYTPAGSRVLGDAIGSAIAATWRPAPAASAGSTK